MKDICFYIHGNIEPTEENIKKIERIIKLEFSSAMIFFMPDTSKPQCVNDKTFEEIEKLNKNYKFENKFNNKNKAMKKSDAMIVIANDEKDFNDEEFIEWWVKGSKKLKYATKHSLNNKINNGERNEI